MAAGRVWSLRRPSVASLSSYIVCPLCRGYLIDATTITTCLHSFCRSCIVRHLQRNNFCPTCRTLSPSADVICPPVKKLRSDRTLQTLIYKLIPGLFENESRRRKEFHQSDHSEQGSGGVGVSATENGRLAGEKEKRNSWVLSGGGRNRMASLIYAGHESINVCLQYCDKFPPRQNIISVGASGQKGKDKEETTVSNGCRYLLCPVFITIGHLKKFLQLKFDLDEICEIDIFHSEENLPNDYTLVDLAYIFHRRKIFDLMLQYVIWEKGITLLSVEDLQRRSDAKSSLSSWSSTIFSSTLPSFPASFADSSISSPVHIRRCRRRRTQLEILGVLRSNANENKPHLQLRSGCAVLRTQSEGTALTANGSTSVPGNGSTSHGDRDEAGASEKQQMTSATGGDDRGYDDGDAVLTEFGLNGHLLSDVAHLEQSIVGFSKGYPHSDCEISLDFAPTEHLPADLSKSSEFSINYNKPSEYLQSSEDSTEKAQLENATKKVLELVETRISDLESVLFDEMGIEGLVESGTFDDVTVGCRKTGYTANLPSLFHIENNDGNQRITTANDVALFGAIQGIQSKPSSVRGLQHLTDADIDREIRSLAADLALRTRSENECGYRAREDEDTPTSPLTIPEDQTPSEEEMGARNNVASDDRTSVSEAVLHDTNVRVGGAAKTEGRAAVFVHPSAICSDETAMEVPSLQSPGRQKACFLGLSGNEPFHQLSAVGNQFFPRKGCRDAEHSKTLVHEGVHTGSNGLVESYLSDETEADSAELVQLNALDKSCSSTCQTQQNISLPPTSVDALDCVTVHKEHLPLTSKERVQNHQIYVANTPSRLEIVSVNEPSGKMRSQIPDAFGSAIRNENSLPISKCGSALAISEKDASNRNLKSSGHGEMSSIGGFAVVSDSDPSKISFESTICPSSTIVNVTSSFPTTTSSSLSTPSMSAQERPSVGTQTNPDLLRRYFKRKSKSLGLFASPKTSSRRTRQRNRLTVTPSRTTEASDAANPLPSVYSISTAPSQSPTSVRLNSYLSERQRLRHVRPSAPSRCPVSPRSNASANSTLSFASPSSFYPPIGIKGAKSTLLITLPAGNAPPPSSTAVVRPSLTIIGSNLSLNRCSVAGTALTPILIQANGISQGLPLQLLIPTINSSMATRSTTTSLTTKTVSSTTTAKRETDTLGAVSSSTAEDDLPSAVPAAASISSDAGDSAIDSSTQSNSQSNSPELGQKVRGRFEPMIVKDATTCRTTGSNVRASSPPSSTPCQSTSRSNRNSESDSKTRKMPSRLSGRSMAKSADTVGASVPRSGFATSSSITCTKLTLQQQQQQRLQPTASRYVDQKRLAGSSKSESLRVDQMSSAKRSSHLPTALPKSQGSSAFALSSSLSPVSVTCSQEVPSALSEGRCQPISRIKDRERTTFCGWPNQSVKTPTTETHSISLRGTVEANATVVASSLSEKGNPTVGRFGSPALGVVSSIKTTERTLGRSVGNKHENDRNEECTTKRLLSGKILHLAPASLIHAILDQKLQQPDAELFDSNSSGLSADAALSSSRHASVLIHDGGSEMNGRQSVITSNQKSSTPSRNIEDERHSIEGMSSEVQTLLKSSAKKEHSTWDFGAFCRRRPLPNAIEKKSCGKTYDACPCKIAKSHSVCHSEFVPLDRCDQVKCFCLGSQPTTFNVFSSSVAQNGYGDKSDTRRKVIGACEAVRISPKVDAFNRCKVLSPSSSSSSSSSSSPCVVAWSGSATESPVSVSSSVVTTDSSSNPCPEESGAGQGGGVGAGGAGAGARGGERKEITSMTVPSSAAPEGTTDKIAPVAEEKGQKAGSHKNVQDVGVCGGISRSHETVSERPSGACSDASASPSVNQLSKTAAASQSQQPQSVDDWMAAKRQFWRASPGQTTKCGAIALPKKVYAYLGSALSKEHLSARQLTTAGDCTTCEQPQPSLPSDRNPIQDVTTPSIVTESLSTPPPTPFYLVPSLSSEDSSAPPIKQLRLMCSGIPYASEATSIVSNSPPAAAAQQPKRKPKKKKKQQTESSECRRTPRIRKTEVLGSSQKEDYAGTRLTGSMNSFVRDHRLPVAEGRLLTR